MARRVSRSIWLAAIILAIAAIVLASMNRLGLGEWFGTAFVIAMSLAYATVGMMITSRQRGNLIGWLFLLVGISFAVYGFREHYVIRSFAAESHFPATVLVAWLGSWMPIYSLLSMPLLFLLYPSGRVPSRRWKPVLWITIASATLIALFITLAPGPLGGFLETGIKIRNPTGVRFANYPGDEGFLLFFVTALALAGSGVASAVALVLRFRRAVGEERQQLRWLAYLGAALAVLLVLMVASTFAESALGPLPEASFLVFFLVIGLGVPAACGIAILKYRLYDLDVVVKKTVVFAIVATFITLVYLAIVLGIPTLVLGIGGEGAFNFVYLVAALVIAMLFQPLRTRARRFADRVVYGKRATPYEVLSAFSERASESFSVDEVLPDMARVLGEGTGAIRADVWLRVGDQLRPATSWPYGNRNAGSEPLHISPEDDLPAIPADRAVPVRHQGELLGALALTKSAADPVTPSDEKLVSDLASQAGLVLRNVRLIEELRASRQRLVAAQDEERRKIERNLHDGAQQQLIALGIKVKLAQSLAEKDPAKTSQMLSGIQGEVQDSVESLRDLARGIYPPLLADKGLAAALDAQGRKAAVQVEVIAIDVGRYAQEVEAAVYFCCLEALNNVAKYASAAHATLRLAATNGTLTFEVEDDGTGFDSSASGYGTGLQGMADRLDAIGGSLRVESSPGRGTKVEGTLPAQPADASAQA
ncbi:MAG: GAF domain-containing sensor histidine kinase [Actinomycetota bacterium]